MNRYLQRFKTKVQRFEEKFEINKETGCWEWIAAKDKGGYGKFDHGKANRASYEIYKGEIPKGMFVCWAIKSAAIKHKAKMMGTQKFQSSS